MRCPTCGKQLDPASTQAPPFCSDRCRQIDLGRWLNEEQRLPVDPFDEREPSDKEEEPLDDE